MVEFLCILMGVVAGVAIFASLLPKYGDRPKVAPLEESDESARILGIADQLNLISHRVAADVCAHSERVGNISERLATPEEIPEQVLATINEIIEANQAMQEQLVDAQMRIAQQSRTIEQTSQQARTDALTGVANRRALNEFVANSIEQKSAAQFTGVMLLDIDHFKAFNDNFGHTTGDAVLANFARALSDYCGGASYVARYGGEEFAVVLVTNSMDEMVNKAAAIRYHVSNQTINHDDLQLKITVSGGLSELLSSDDCQTVCERADKGLYQAKKAGRNCGFWLSDEGWQPFPAITAEPPAVAALGPITAAAMPVTAAAKQPGTATQSSSVVPPASAIDEGAADALCPAATSPATTSHWVNAADAEHSGELTAEAAQVASSDSTKAALASTPKQLDILDLKTFLGRLEVFVGQLRTAELPGTAFMLEAVGLRSSQGSNAGASWNHAVQIVMQNLRGIDVPCLYRPYTLCVFLPSCSLDAGVARAAKIKRALLEASGQWDSAAACESLAVCVASIGVAEDNASFLNRLELALETAADSSPQEIVTHDGNTCHFLET